MLDFLRERGVAALPTLLTGIVVVASSCAGPDQASASPHPWNRVGRGLRSSPHALWDDARRSFTQRNTVGLAFLGMALPRLGLADDDEPIARHFREQETYGKDVSHFFSTYGGAGFLLTSSAAWTLVSARRGDERGYEAGKAIMSSLVLTGTTTAFLKFAVDDGRPDDGLYGFPSGHAGMSMALATTVGEFYGQAVAVPFYLLSVGTVIQRLDNGRHDLEDILFGWALGYTIGRAVGGERNARLMGGNVGAFLDPATGRVGIGLTWTN